MTQSSPLRDLQCRRGENTVYIRRIGASVGVESVGFVNRQIAQNQCFHFLTTISLDKSALRSNYPNPFALKQAPSCVSFPKFLGTLFPQTHPIAYSNSIVIMTCQSFPEPLFYSLRRASVFSLKAALGQLNRVHQPCLSFMSFHFIVSKPVFYMEACFPSGLLPGVHSADKMPGVVLGNKNRHAANVC